MGFKTSSFLTIVKADSSMLLKFVFSPRFLETLGCSYNIMHNSHVYDMIYYFCELEFFCSGCTSNMFNLPDTVVVPSWLINVKST